MSIREGGKFSYRFARRRNWVLITFLWLGVITPTIVQAAGFRVFGQSASGAGQGNAFTAQSDDPSAVAYNPAGMTQLDGIQLIIGAALVTGSTEFTQRATGETSRGDFGRKIANPPPVHIYMTAHLRGVAQDRFTLGIGLFSPYGLKYEWPKDGLLNTSITRIALPLSDIRPVIAYKLTEQLSFAAGADVYTFLGHRKAKTEFNSSGGPGLPPAGTPIEINGEDTSTALNLSLYYTPCLSDRRPRCSIGVQYRGETDLDLEGEFLVAGSSVADARTTVVIPQSLTVGVAVWPVRNEHREWKIEVDVDKTDWSSFQDTDVRLSSGSVISVSRNWEDVYTFMVGTEYKWLHPEALPQWDVAARAGYMYAPTPVPERTFDPGIADADSHIFSVGLGFLRKATVGIDLGYQVVFRKDRRVDESAPPLTSPAIVNGTYETVHHFGLLSVRVNF